MRKRTIARTLLGGALLLGVLGGGSSEGPRQPRYLPEVGVPQYSAPLDTVTPQKETIFFEDFSSPTLDLSSWNIEVTGEGFHTTNKENQAYINSPKTIRLISKSSEVHLQENVLALNAIYVPGYQAADGKTYNFQSGRITTEDLFTYQYGTATARIKVEGASGVWPAFWQLGADVDTVKWPHSGEIDIFENVGDRLWVSTAIHGPGYSGNTPFSNRYKYPTANVNEWHEYGVTWTPTKITFHTDGITTHIVDKQKVGWYGEWQFDKPNHLLLNLAVGGNYPASVNKVSKPYHGVPLKTVDLIKDGKVRMLVDWVKVTR